MEEPHAGCANSLTGGVDYHPMTDGSLSAYLAGFEAVASILGGRPDQWRVSEVGDGNLNLVFIVKGPAGAVVVKQALPYVRLVGELLAAAAGSLLL